MDREAAKVVEQHDNSVQLGSGVATNGTARRVSRGVAPQRANHRSGVASRDEVHDEVKRECVAK